MQPTFDDITRVLAQLAQGPQRIAAATEAIPVAQLQQRSEAEPWSVADILAHLRACSDLWGAAINAMLTEDNPKRRYVSPRSWVKKPTYAEQEFAVALDLFTLERQKLIATLDALDGAGWQRPGTFTGTSPRQRNQTVFSYAERIVNHEQPHLEQIEEYGIWLTN